MSLKVSILSGRNTPWSGEFDKDEVSIGRAAAADVRLHPTGDTICASGVHCRLLRRSARWFVEVDHANGATLRLRRGTPHYLEKGGRAALGNDNELAIGRSGPRLRIVSGETPLTAAPAGIDVQITTGANSPWRATFDKDEIRRTFPTSVAAGLVVALVLLGLGLKWWSGSSGSDDERVRAALQKTQPGVYIVLATDEKGNLNTSLGVATAWAVETNRLATNAHVAELVDEIRRAGLRPVARRPGKPPIDLPIIGTKVHPGYGRWKPVCQGMLISRSGSLVELPPIFDVAILMVDGDVGSPLPLADDREIRDLGPATVIGYQGYPGENLAGLQDNPVPTVAIGKVNKLTDPLGESGDDVSRILIHFDMVATGGASGSPILNPEGHVVGLLNGGSVITSPNGRIPTGFNMGQRVDLLRELLDNTAEARQKKRNEQLQAKMDQTMAAPEDVALIVARVQLSKLVQVNAVPPDARLRRVFAKTDALRAGSENGNTSSLSLKPHTAYICVGCASDYSNLDLVVRLGSVVVSKDVAPAWFAVCDMTAKTGVTADLVAYADKTYGEQAKSYVAVFLVEF